jgi:hypothetical protein
MTLLWTLSVLVGTIGLTWIARHYFLNKYIKDHPWLRSDEPGSPIPDPPLVSVLVAAKDEEEVIENCLRSIQAQDYPNYEIIVIDDRSDDRTAEIVQGLADRDSRIRLVRILDLPDGWFGKHHAMHMGVSHAQGRWICMTDADCTHTSPRTLSIAMRFADKRKIDFLSIVPTLEMISFAEKVVQMVCGTVMIFWFQPKYVNDPNHPTAYANGAFMLLKREIYERLGGHEAVKDRINEDVPMARLAKQAGARLFVIGNEDLLKVRMYTSLGAIWRGWSRIFYGCFDGLSQHVVSILLIAVMSVLPWLTLGVAIAWRILAPDPPPAELPWLLGSSLFAVIAQQSLVARLYRQHGHNPVYALGWIVGAVLTIGMIIHAVFKLAGQSTDWRGTRYRRSRA